jgi:hypothetical protein
VKRAEEQAQADGIWWFRQDGGCHGEEGEERLSLISGWVDFLIRWDLF